MHAGRWMGQVINFVKSRGLYNTTVAYKGYRSQPQIPDNMFGLLTMSKMMGLSKMWLTAIMQPMFITAKPISTAYCTIIHHVSG